MSQRFSYIKYDEKSAALQARFRAAFEAIEEMVHKELADSRPKSLIFTKLEEAYMWVGKSIRDTQLAQRGGAEQPERNNE